MAMFLPVNILGVVLAGGKSTRMGKNKSELIYNNKTLLQHAQQKLALAGCKKIVISDKNNLPDATPNTGPLGGISTVLNHYPNQKLFLFLPVDMPNLTVEYLLQLIETILENENLQAVYFQDSPLPFVLNVNGISEIPTKGSVKKFLAKLNVQALPAPQKDLENINTPAQWQNFLGNDL